MTRLRLLILVFGLVLAIPLGFVVARTYQSLEQQEVAELRFFGEALFDRIQADLAELVRREEARPLDAYVAERGPSSPLFDLPEDAYILGWFQTGPDGEFQTPLAKTPQTPDRSQRIQELEEVHAAFNNALSGYSAPPLPEPAAPFTELKKEKPLEDRYFTASKATRRKQVLGQESERFEMITPEQALNLSRADGKARPGADAASDAAADSVTEEVLRAERNVPSWSLGESEVSQPVDKGDTRDIAARPTWQAEIAPLQALPLDEAYVVLFRRVMVGNQVLRQGLVLRTRTLLEHLVQTHFSGHPMSRFTALTLVAPDSVPFHGGATVDTARYRMERVFPRPFAFLQAELSASDPPASPGRDLLTTMVVILGGVFLLGLVAIERSAKVITEHSKRRTGFVSSVTHELKTPLTNIRLYTEMLEQGVAHDREREEEYLRIIGSESKRLSRLITNVLEFSRLERRQRPMDLVSGTMDEVLSEVRDIMEPKVQQEGFALLLQKQDIPAFSYDREALIQILINLVDNSLKFSRQATRREILLVVRSQPDHVVVSVTDFGPGIPKHALKRVFDDFYRVENDLTRNTKGTGIGLSLVKRFVTAMHGSIAVQNNPEGGCTFEMRFPVDKKGSGRTSLDKRSKIKD